MEGFGQASFGKEYLILDGQTVEASFAYQRIYGLAKRSIYVIDNYFNLKTLLHLTHASTKIDITIFSDNAGRGLTKQDMTDFQKEYPEMAIALKTTRGKFHDRFIVLDYGTCTERVYFCGSSSKDSGKRTAVIAESSMCEIYHSTFDELLQNPSLVLK